MLAVKVTFLNDELTEAQLQRGIWWWKRIALVRLVTTKVDRGDKCPADFRTAWKFEASGEECSEGLAHAINDVRAREKWLRLDARDWQRPSSRKTLPEARTVQR
jgi:hypothetical protein